MRNYFILLFALITFSGSAQISFGARHRGKPADLKKETLERFKSTTTIFVLSDVIDISEYERILKDTWTVTPFKLISHDEFDLLNMYHENYSFALLNGFKSVKTSNSGRRSVSLHTYFDVAMYNAEDIDEKLKKLSPKRKEKKIDDIFWDNKESIAKFYLFPKYDFVETALKEEDEVIMESIYKKDVFFNYTKGMLRNYLQKVNELINNERTYWMYEKDFDAEKIAVLTSSKLYVPKYAVLKTNAFTANFYNRKEKDVNELFDKYDYEYQFISKKDLDAGIEEGKEFYYLRYIRVNSEKFVQVVNSKTGNVVFRDYIPGLGYNLKAKHIEYLSKVITKSKKKLAK